jgi:predicted site-specific integrase-resolvase
MSKFDGRFVTIAEACKRLGISPNTLRSWGAGGKIQEYRHPINNYRLYSLDDISRLAGVLRRPIKVDGATVRVRPAQPS